MSIKKIVGSAVCALLWYACFIAAAEFEPDVLFMEIGSAELLVPDISTTGEISGSSDLDVYEFFLNADESYLIRSADVSGVGFCPGANLFDPAGNLINSTQGLFGCPVGVLEGRAQVAGLYQLQVADVPSVGGTSGAYRLLLVVVPGSNQGGQIPNGGSVLGELVYGDIDTFTFFANAGDGIALRSGELSSPPFAVIMQLFAPDGLLVAAAAPASAIVPIEIGASQTGVYTVAITDNLGVNPSVFGGDYELHLTKVPGAMGDGILASGDVVEGEITIGDLDSFGFFAAQGEVFELELNQTADLPFTSVLALFDPSGAFLGRVNAAPSGVSAPLVWTATASGAYSAVISDDLVFTGVAGPYTVSLVKTLELCGSTTDTDGDSVPDSCDNCTFAANVSQFDGDLDGFGNECDADFNGDCVVNIVDLGILRTAFFTDDSVADLNLDGVVNVVDLGLIRAAFFAPPGPSALASCQ